MKDSRDMRDSKERDSERERVLFSKSGAKASGSGSSGSSCTGGKSDKREKGKSTAELAEDLLACADRSVALPALFDVSLLVRFPHSCGSTVHERLDFKRPI